MQVSQTSFFDSLSSFQNVPFLSAKGWNLFLDARENAAYFLDSVENPTIGAWGRVFSLPGIGKILQLQSEVLNHPDSETISAFYREMISCDYAMILLSSLRDSSPELEYTIRKTGFVRPYGFTLCPLSILVDLQHPELRHRSWKKNVKRAANDGLSFRKVENPDISDCKIFANIYEEMAISKKIKHRLDAEKLLKLFQDPGFELYFVSKENEILSAEIVYVHHKNSEGVFGANSRNSRKYSASYLLRERLFETLAERGIEHFDFSRIAPGLNSADSLCEFKLSSGGKIIQYFGEWVWAKNPYIELLYLIYRQFLKHGARY